MLNITIRCLTRFIRVQPVSSAHIDVGMLGQAPVQGEGPRLVTQLPAGRGGRGVLARAGGGDQDIVLLLASLEKVIESSCSCMRCFCLFVCVPISVCKCR